MKTNFQLILDGILKDISSSGKTPKLLLHSCCGPCSSYVLEYLSKYFDITVFFYNPNISPKEEYLKRVEAQRRIVEMMPFTNPVKLIVCDYNESEFYNAVKGFESYPEGGARCPLCFTLRLGKTAEAARDMKFDYFATTLTVSPHKNAELINAIGSKLSEEYGVKYLPSDFKKREGYKRSIELSKEYDLYRQDYCGCSFANIR